MKLLLNGFIEMDLLEPEFEPGDRTKIKAWHEGNKINISPNFISEYFTNTDWKASGKPFFLLSMGGGKSYDIIGTPEELSVLLKGITQRKNEQERADREIRDELVALAKKQIDDATDPGL